jgi:hypothetical protein
MIKKKKERKKEKENFKVGQCLVVCVLDVI